jgi:hypothetical protein
MAIKDINSGIKLTCRVVFYVNKGEPPSPDVPTPDVPSYVEGEVWYTDGTVENDTLILKKGVVNNGVLTL